MRGNLVGSSKKYFLRDRIVFHGTVLFPLENDYYYLLLDIEVGSPTLFPVILIWAEWEIGFYLFVSIKNSRFFLISSQNL